MENSNDTKNHGQARASWMDGSVTRLAAHPKYVPHCRIKDPTSPYPLAPIVVLSYAGLRNDEPSVQEKHRQLLQHIAKAYRDPSDDNFASAIAHAKKYLELRTDTRKEAARNLAVEWTKVGIGSFFTLLCAGGAYDMSWSGKSEFATAFAAAAGILGVTTGLVGGRVTQDRKDLKRLRNDVQAAEAQHKALLRARDQWEQQQARSRDFMA